MTSLDQIVSIVFANNIYILGILEKYGADKLHEVLT